MWNRVLKSTVSGYGYGYNYNNMNANNLQGGAGAGPQGQQPVVPSPPPPPTQSQVNAQTRAQMVQNAKAVCNKVAQSRILVSLLVFLVTIILLISLNPPMAQESDTDVPPGQTPARSWKKITVWATIAMLMALILPFACGGGSGAKGSECG